MSLLAQIKSDALAARKSKDSVASSLLVTLSSEAARVGLDDGKRESTDAEVIATVKKFLKNNSELLNVRPDDATALREQELLMVYLPKQMDGEQLKAAVLVILNDLNLDSVGKNMGVVMKELKARHEGSYSGAEASSLLKQM